MVGATSTHRVAREQRKEQMARTNLAERIEHEIERQAGLSIVVEEDAGIIFLSGIVDTPEARQAAEDIATSVAPNVPVDNGLDVPPVAPLNADRFDVDLPTVSALPDDSGEIGDPAAEIDPSFTNEPEVTPDSDPDEEASTYFLPTDPVIATDERGEAYVLGGFSPTADADVTVGTSALDGKPGDEAIADAVRRELREDAATTALDIAVSVQGGVVTLRGTVEGIEDAENAEAVAGRVTGVIDVVDETVVPGI
jgi:osmotically-inducible protein OsmY